MRLSLKREPRVIIQTYENHRVIFEAFALVG